MTPIGSILTTTAPTSRYTLGKHGVAGDEVAKEWHDPDAATQGDNLQGISNHNPAPGISGA
jgi:hypothetical protein